jgi:CheY-like chemotaxis protein
MSPDIPVAADPPDEPGEPPAILNVNDDDANRFALTRMLRRTGYRVEEARTGGEALRLVVEARPDLVVLDVDLPDIDGFEVCRRIKADPETAAIPVLHLSAQYVREEDRAHGLVSGADGYLVQPVEPPELDASIRGLLRMRKAEDAARESARRVEQLELELRGLERLAASPPSAAGCGPQPRPLREGHPDAFGELVARCEHLLDLALQQQKYKVQHDISAALRDLGDRLGALGAGPRDVIEVYGTALKSRSAGALAARARAYLDEGRLLVLELMGHLVSYYRDPPAEGGRRPEP